MGNVKLARRFFQNRIKHIEFFDRYDLPLFGSSQYTVTHELSRAFDIDNSIIIADFDRTVESDWRSDCSLALIKFEDEQTLHAEREVASDNYLSISSGYVIEFEDVKRKFSEILTFENGTSTSIIIPDEVDPEKCIFTFTRMTDEDILPDSFSPLEYDLTVDNGETEIRILSLATKLRYELLEFE